MHCPSCHAEDTSVIDSRVIEDGATIRRRRQCDQCHFRFSTREEIEILTLTVVKANAVEQPYDRDKLVRGLSIALQKRAIQSDRLRRTVHAIEQDIQSKAKHDRIASRDIGEIVMKHLRKLDKVAYIRFASVYRSFEDPAAFADELQRLSPKSTKLRKTS